MSLEWSGTEGARVAFKDFPEGMLLPLVLTDDGNDRLSAERGLLSDEAGLTLQEGHTYALMLEDLTQGARRRAREDRN